MDDEAKKLILARRARFIVAALAGMSATACGGETTLPPGGHDAGSANDASADTSPMPCLGAPAPDASPDADIDAGPQPCLVPR